MNRMFVYAWIGIYQIFLSLSAYCQKETSYTPQVWEIDTLMITGSRTDLLLSGHKVLSIDSLSLRQMKTRNVADILTTFSDVFIKSYGLGSLATTSLRGGGASHTAILWNGISLISPMNGQLDLSLLPAFFLDDLRVQYGSSSALYGSGAIGGTLQIRNQQQFNTGWNAALFSQWGSFQRQSYGVDVGVGKEKWYSRTRSFLLRSENDFPLPASSDRQTNATIRQWGMLQEVGWKIKARHVVHLKAWFQDNDRDIPPPLSSQISEANQQDESLRLLSTYEFQGNKLRIRSRTALLNDQLLFVDPLANIDADNRSLSIIQEWDAYWSISPQHTFYGGFNYNRQTAEADGLSASLPSRHIGAILGAYKYRSITGKVEASLSVRKGFSSDVAVPIIPSLSIRTQLLPQTLFPRNKHILHMRGQLGRSFRQPTFNDLYWDPGGNPELLSEKGWNQELGVEWQLKLPSFQSQLDLAGFSQAVDNWILWRPGAQFWFPENLRKVWSRGWELAYQWNKQMRKWKWTGNIGYTNTYATNTKVQQRRDNSLGKQLIYTPIHQARGSIQLHTHTIALTYAHVLVGRQYTTSDNSRSLPSYQLGNVSLAYQLPFRHFQSHISFQAENIWNAEYQVIESRAMPGRNYLFTIECNIHKY